LIVFAERLKAYVSSFCRLSEAQLQLLQQHYELLVRWNRVLNLTSIREEDAIVRRHYAESLFLACHLEGHAASAADLGSGAGFPGFPVAVLHPEFLVTLVESHQRKAVFLREVTRGMANVHVAPVRAGTMEQVFDWAICRAVRYQDVQSELVRLGRQCALLTGETEVAKLYGFDWQQPLLLPWGERRFLLLGRNVSRGT
jgi:16S rRNA (guanine527-N7)-methyltransferase